MLRLRSATSASLRVILAQVCANSYTKMYNNRSYTSMCTRREQKSESQITNSDVSQTYAMESLY